MLCWSTHAPETQADNPSLKVLANLCGFKWTSAIQNRAEAQEPNLVVLLAVIGAALVGGVVIQVHRIGTASMVAGIQTCCLISSRHTEEAQELEHIEEDEHVDQHPGCTANGQHVSVDMTQIQQSPWLAATGADTASDSADTSCLDVKPVHLFSRGFACLKEAATNVFWMQVLHI